MKDGLSHLDPAGNARMVDVGAKPVTERRAVAGCEVQMHPETLRLMHGGHLKKGDAFTVAKVAGILAAKKTPELIPFCHPLLLEHIEIRFLDRPQGDGVFIECEVRTTSKTGVEMEALSGAMGAALTLYDMVKGVDRGLVITNLHLIEKKGGKNDFSGSNGDYHGK